MVTARDHLVDAARVLAVGVVVAYHCVFFEVGLADGRLLVERWVPERPLLILGWVVMVLPLFFVTTGYGHAASAAAQRPAAATRGALARLAHRGARLSGPILLLVTVLAVLATVAARWPGAPPSLPYPGTAGLGWLDLATALSRDYADYLWFLVSYLTVVLVADPMVRLHDHVGVSALLVLGAGAALVDQVGPRGANWVLVWLACHQLGIGLRRGWFDGRLLPWVSVTTAAAGVVALVAVAGYPLSPVSNYYPPSVAIVVLGVAQTGALGLLRQAGVLRRVTAETERRLAVIGAHLVKVYLWQAACIVLAILLLATVGRGVPGLAPVVMHPLVILVAAGGVIVAVVPWIARVERRLVPPVVSVRGGVAAFALLLAGTALVWQHGTVLHADRPWSTAGVTLVWAAAILLRRG